MKFRIPVKYWIEGLVVAGVLVLALTLGFQRFMNAQVRMKVAQIHFHVKDILYSQMLYQMEWDTVEHHKGAFFSFSGINHARHFGTPAHLTTPFPYLLRIPDHPFHDELSNLYPLCIGDYFSVYEHIAQRPLPDWHPDYKPVKKLGASVTTSGPGGLIPRCGRYILPDELARHRAQNLHLYDPNRRFIAHPVFSPWRFYNPSNGLLSAGWIVADSLGRRSEGFW